MPKRRNKGKAADRGSGRPKNDASTQRNLFVAAALVVVAIAAMLQTGLFAGPPALPSGMQRIRTDNERQMKEVFFGSQPWLLFCTNKTLPDPKASKVLTTAAKKLGKGFAVGVLDCGNRLPSGHSVFERFRIKPSKSQQALVLAANGKTTQIPRKKARAWKLLKAYVEEKVKVRVPKVGSAKQWEKHCLNHRTCAALLVSASEKKMAHKLARKHRNVQFVMLNTTRHHLEDSQGQPFLGNLQGGRPVLHLFKRRRDGAMSCISYDGAFTSHNMAKFVKAAMQADHGDEMEGELFLEQDELPQIIRNRRAAAKEKPRVSQEDTREEAKLTEEELAELEQQRKDEQHRREQARRERMEKEAESYIPQAGDEGDDIDEAEFEDDEEQMDAEDDEVELGEDEDGDEMELGDDEDEVELDDEEDE